MYNEYLEKDTWNLCPIVLEEAIKDRMTKGKSAGTFGRFGVLSFNWNKIITTSSGRVLV